MKYLQFKQFTKELEMCVRLLVREAEEEFLHQWKVKQDTQQVIPI